MCAPGVAGAEVVSDSGALKADVGTAPFSLELQDRKRRRVLNQHPGTGTGATGALGFKTALGWSRATRVISDTSSSGAYLAELETTDPLRTISLELEPDGPGVIALRARVVGPAAGIEAIGMGFDAPAGERYLGFGERSNQVDQTGAAIESYVADGPYQDEEYTGISAFVPPWGLRSGRKDATYFPIPWLLSSEGYGVLVDNPETAIHRLGSDNAAAWSVEVVKAPAGQPGSELGPPVTELRLRFFAGPRPAKALERFTDAVGRQPAADAPWVYGPWYQPGNDAEDLAALRDADAPVSVIQTYAHYLPCGEQDTERERARTVAAHAAGVAITTYFNPMVCTNYAPAYGPVSAADALTETRAGAPYTYRYGANFDDLFVVGQYDFFEAAGRELYGDRLQEAVDDGYDGWMEDFGEYTPLDSVSAENIDGTRAHNEYPTRYHCAAYDAVRDQPRPVVRFQRSGWTGAAKCAQVVWGGDPTTGWGFDGLRSAMTQALSIGSSGVGIWGSDIGGFFALGFNKLTPELLTRWVQFGAVSGVMRTQRNGVGLPPRGRPQVTDDDQISNWRRYAKLHTQLYPYIRGAERDYRERGLPLMRHLLLAYPGDERAAMTEDEFLFGPHLLAAPVVDEGETERDIYLPQGRWVDLWRSATYDESSGGIDLGGAEVLRGPADVTVPAPLEELPLLVRAGTVIPLLPRDVDTLADDGGRTDLTSLADRENRLELLAFPRKKRSGRLGERGRWISRTKPGGWTLKLKTPERTRYDLQAALGVAGRNMVPCKLKLNGRKLKRKRWSYDAQAEVLTARFATRKGRLKLVRRSC
jgi:alpha-glucosidase (family GH31 glycosyl hydrolase)